MILGVEYKKNQRGFTLLEVLLSIILLFIILTSFMVFFSQSSLFTKKNEQKLETSQTAQQVVNLIDENITKQILQTNNNTSGILGLQNTTINLANKTIFNDLIKPATFSTPYNLNLELKNNQTSQKLIQIKVIVTDPNNTVNKSETYTYIKR